MPLLFRTNTLTCVTAEAGQFQATCKSIQDWLDKMDKQSADVIFAGSVKDRIENEIEHQQARKILLVSPACQQDTVFYLR